MSHFTTIQTQIRDLEALHDACAEMDLKLVQNANCRGYAGITRQAPHVIKLKGPYDIAVDPHPENDGTRYVLNGVHFTPEEGGMLIATDGKRLAGAPARVPGRSFTLPTTAVHVLVHPDFSTRDAAVLQADDDEGEKSTHLQFRSGPHTFIAKTIEGHYPNYRNVIPGYLPQSVTIPETHRPALIAWLRSLKGTSNSVRLTWETPSHFTLTHRDYDTVGATLQVPVTIEGQPPAIAFEPKYLADALEIGPTFRLVDKLNPGMTTSPSGNFCVLMSQRFTEETAKEDTANETPAPAVAA